MHYETAVQVFFQPVPVGTPTPHPVAHAGPARRLRDACEPLAIHAAWNRLTNERLAAHGLNFLTAYVWGLNLREEIEKQTDAMEQPLVEAVGHDLDALVTQLDAWSELCIKAGAFPPNQQKRAAG